MSDDRIPPMAFTWNGEAMVPKVPKLADRHFVIGEVVYLEPYNARSRATHSHYFACVHEAFLNLPQDQAERFPTEDHLRKYALIRAGYRDERTIACASRAEALRFAAFVRPMDQYAVITVHESVVRVWTAQSQSMKAMGRKDFAESKTKVLDFLSQMIGVDPADLSRARAA